MLLPPSLLQEQLVAGDGSFRMVRWAGSSSCVLKNRFSSSSFCRVAHACVLADYLVTEALLEVWIQGRLRWCQERFRISRPSSPSLAPAVGRESWGNQARVARPPQNSITSTTSAFPLRERRCPVESQHARRAMCIWAVIDWMAMQAEITAYDWPGGCRRPTTSEH
jgi:hypothetical protein